MGIVNKLKALKLSGAERQEFIVTQYGNLVTAIYKFIVNKFPKKSVLRNLYKIILEYPNKTDICLGAISKQENF